MRTGILIIAIVAAASFASAQIRPDTFVPDSSIEKPSDVGVRVHTNYFIHAPGGVLTHRAQASEAAETPGSLSCVYDLVSTPVKGCPISTATEVSTGGSGVIVIVDAYDYPSAAADLKTFSSTYGLPTPTFTTAYGSGKKPSDACSSGWEGEESLDIEWAHAMAPNAQIVLMEAASNSNTDMFAAVKAANSYIAKHGGKGEVSMSWGGSEFSGETTYDSYFSQKDVVYFASSGDASGVIYPSASPDVVSAGGVQVVRNAKGAYTKQEATTSCGSGCGGGVSAYEKIPSYQSSVKTIVGTWRGTPDIAFDSSENSWVSVYNSACYDSWLDVWGTSVASPSLAGIINNAGTFNASSNAQNTEMYADRTITADYTDVTTGSCATHKAAKGYDLCTGIGAPKGLLDK
ncbi:MAG: S53 family peptidase [Terriglobales bacterium]